MAPTTGQKCNMIVKKNVTIAKHHEGNLIGGYLYVNADDMLCDLTDLLNLEKINRYNDNDVLAR